LEQSLLKSYPLTPRVTSIEKVSEATWMPRSKMDPEMKMTKQIQVKELYQAQAKLSLAVLEKKPQDSCLVN